METNQLMHLTDTISLIKIGDLGKKELYQIIDSSKDDVSKRITVDKVTGEAYRYTAITDEPMTFVSLQEAIGDFLLRKDERHVKRNP